ncbi:hypothetical protein SAMN04489761_2759 [Tenacibaculum sp. MAR_2009_124]|uniref:hypothetical protein n=1 Tax=Tenacibaculum sp. MAR_2009_124 TaxID=1250059 RepID=UPI0008958ACF|nr:hypothetical protein [Tenacibaculum sp. MAR_2009_124]SEC35454.1 hypothetical protein SAMN04489761_2759 [Tenacibaculum sp. MAR_2009_124]
MSKRKEGTGDKWSWYETKYEMAEFILERLKNYQENYNKNGYSLPVWVLEDGDRKEYYSDKDEIEMKINWNKELNEMINTFNQILSYKFQFNEKFEYDEGKIQEGLNKFSKYYLHFWD